MIKRWCLSEKSLRLCIIKGMKENNSIIKGIEENNRNNKGNDEYYHGLSLHVRTVVVVTEAKVRKAVK